MLSGGDEEFDLSDIISPQKMQEAKSKQQCSIKIDFENYNNLKEQA